MTDGDADVQIFPDGQLGDEFDQGLAMLTHLPEGVVASQLVSVTIPPATSAVAHDHGTRAMLVHVAHGHGRILWGRQLGKSARIIAGDSIVIQPSVFHQEVNDSAVEELRLVILNFTGENLPWTDMHRLAH
jgi:uncharacterized RmlC-like cupin family protein